MYDTSPFPVTENTPTPNLLPVIKVLGLGGGGCNAVNRMIELGIEGVEFICANTDHQALKNYLAPVKIQMGPKTTRGLGAGGIPSVGKAAAEESWHEISDALKGADMVFVTAGMGGGTGTGSIPVAAKIARAQGAVTIAVVTMPFSFEMGRRQKNATEGITSLRPNTDTLISIPNDRLLYVAPRNLPLETAFRMADDVLRQAVQGITELITEPGMINVDFAHVRHLMKLGGGALMSIGQGEGENKALKAIQNALYHPLLDNTSLDNAAGILVNFTAGEDLTLFEVEEACNYLHKQSGGNAEIVMGVINDNRMDNRVQVILVVTGLGAVSLEETLSRVKKPVETTSNGEFTPIPAPAVHNAAQQVRQPATITRQVPTISSNNLDIPSFLRRGK
jgi:cell division protein FtsZ